MTGTDNDRKTEGKGSDMKNKELVIKIFAGVMAAIMIFVTVAGVLLYLV